MPAAVRLALALALAPVAALALTACPAEPCAPTWTVALDQPGGPLLAGWGRAADDAWLVGGGLGQGGARIVRWTGQPTEAAAALGVDRAETLWWVWGSPGGTLWMVGEGGLALRGPADGSAAMTVVPTGTTATLYGVWGRGDDDVWIVGGLANQVADADDDLVLHWDGQGLTRVDLPRRAGALFKVWGPPDGDGDDLWLSGEAGALWRRHAGAWHDHARATPASVLTVHGCAADEAYAVGGRHVWQWDGATWTEVAGLPSFALAAGVACGPTDVLVVGAQGLRLRRDRATGAWHDDQLAPYLATDLHGAWAAPDGTLVAVGGDYLLPVADRHGVIAVRGCP